MQGTKQVFFGSSIKQTDFREHVVDGTSAQTKNNTTKSRGPTGNKILLAYFILIGSFPTWVARCLFLHEFTHERRERLTQLLGGGN